VKIESPDQSGDAVGVEVEGVDLQIARLRAEAEADEVGGDDADVFPREDSDDLAPKIAPGGIAVQEENGRAVSLVDEVDFVLAVREKTAVEGQLFREPGRERRRREELGGHYFRFLTVLCSTSCAALAALASV
jgi:hypothetical protein